MGTVPASEPVIALAGPMCFPRADRFEEWLHAPATLESADARFDVRRARPEEFDRIYDLVNDTFRFKRSRARYDWIYRRNPWGTARCWVVFDRASGRLLSSMASWPWPMARGTQGIEGAQDGDSVVSPEWQRQGIDRLRTDVWRSHAWQAQTIGVSWPNAKSRGAAVKRGRGPRIIGPVPRAVLLLDPKAYLAEHGWPGLASVTAGSVLDAVLTVWRGALLRPREVLSIEAIRRFEVSFDALTQRCMMWPGFWVPHNADFLNWRYLDHPTAQYVAFAVADHGALAGYYVLRVEERSSWLMEFVAPVMPRGPAFALLRHMVATARDAGCRHLQFSAPPRWRHWKLLRAAGFVPAHSDIYMWPAGDEPELRDLAEWQWVPGDMDDV